MKHVFIVNPISGHQNALELIPSIERYFESNPHEYIIHLTQYPKHATEIASQYHNSDDVTIYACGGDGTINEVFNGLAPSVPMAVIPVGTGNDFFSMLKIKETKLEDILKATIEGKEVLVDAGQCNDLRFVEAMSMGFDADVAAYANTLSRQKWLPSSMVYWTSVIKNIVSRKTYHMTIDIDGKTINEKLLLIAIMNGRAYGGGFLPTPYSDIQDGYLDICVIENAALPKILNALPKYQKGTHLKLDIVRFYKAKNLKIQTNQDVHMQRDGEVSVARNLNISILEKGLKLRVPHSSPLKENL